jgi:hypothetical protein
VAVAVLLAVMPQAASAQFGALRRLKNAISPDSAAKVEAAKEDSIALAAKVAAGDTTPLQRSKFSRAVSAAGAASDKFEAVTGVSTKDAALAATGVGASGLIAKKMGVDPMSLGKQALNLRQQGAQANASGIAGMPRMPGMSGTPSIPGMPNMADLLKMQQAATSQLQNLPKARAGGELTTGNPMLGLTEADARALAAFQQEMMQVAMAASGGDLAAQARLQSWEAIALKYQPEIEKLSISAGAGDFAAVQKLQAIQVNIIKEWANTGSAQSAKVNKAIKAVKATKP